MNVFTSNDYARYWKQVDSLQQKGLPQSALKVVNTIYEKAKAENQPDQLVKAVIHRLKFTAYTEEDAFVLSLIDLKKEAAKATLPARPILHSMLAEMYWAYYQQNRYRFLQRTAIQDVEADDLRTWDLRKVVEQVQTHYLLSLQAPEKLQQTPVSVYDAIVIQGKGAHGRKLRPTLYDFLAHRAIDFFGHSESTLTQPADQFLLREEVYFAPAETFAAHRISTTDSLNFTFQATHLFQELLQFRLKENNLPALVEVDLKRLDFVYRQSVHPQKEALYRQALEALEATYAQQEVSAEVSYQLALQLYNSSQQYKPLESEQHRWEAKQAYERCATTIGRFPKSIGAQDCRSLQATLQTKHIEITLEKINLPHENLRGLVSFKNVGKLFVRVVKTNEEEFRKIHGKKYSYRDDAYYEKLIGYYAAQKPVHQFDLTLPDAGDYQQHAAEFRIPALPLGDYILLAGTNAALSYTGNAVAYDFFSVSSLSYLHRSVESGEIEFYVTDRKTGTPLPGVHAQLLSEEYDSKSRENVRTKGQAFTTDSNGYFKVPAPRNYRNFMVEFTHQGDRLLTSDRYDSQGYGDTFYQNAPYQQDTGVATRSFYFTDRAIYRPGQAIYFKGILLKTDGKHFHQLLKKHPVRVTLSDVNGQEVATLNLTTNEFGTFSGTFTAPTSGLNGEMSLSDGNGTAVFSVEDYKRPKFEVEMPPLQGAFRLGHAVQVKGQAKAYSGANIDNAAVKFRVVRKAIFPYWWYCWKGFYPTSPAVEISNGITQTDANGAFAIEFQAIPDLSVPKESKPTYTYTIYVDVTDQNGETRSSEKSVRIGYAALKLGVDMPEVLEVESNPEVAIRTLNLNDEFEASRGTIRIDRLKSPEKPFRKRRWTRPDTFLLTKETFDQAFPHDAYDEEDNPFKWAKEAKVLEEPFNTGQSKILPLKDLAKWKPGKYVLEINATDAFGEAVKEVAYFTVIDRKSKTMPFASVNAFNVLKGKGEPGERAALLVGSSEKLSVLYEWEKDEKIIARQWLTVEPGQKLLDIPLTEAFRGNIGVHYTFVHQNRLYKNQTTIVVPYTNKELDVTFETFRNKLLPGEKETWKIRIRGKKGEKVAAEMVATLYDASLDAFRANTFALDIYQTCYATLDWSSTGGFDNTEATLHNVSWNRSVNGYPKNYDYLNWFGYGVYHYEQRVYGMSARRVGASPKIVIRGVTSNISEKEMSDESAAAAAYGNLTFTASAPALNERRKDKSKPEDKPAPEELVKARTNFQETAFFYPHLQTDANGDVLVSFTIPEALTRWKMLGFAHTQNLQYGLAANTLVTQKELMITSNAPRFFREGDAMAFTAKVANLSEQDLSGTAQLLLFDALTMKPVDAAFGNPQTSQPFTVKKGQSSGLTWQLRIPEGLEAVTYRVVAKAGSHSDGEEMPVPILTNRLLVTETLPLPVRGNQTKTFQLDKLVNQQSATLRNHRLTLEFTANPAWYAVQALPYLMEYPYECAEQNFSRFYANSLASHIANANPKIKRVFESWKSTDSKALVSNLAKNPELKALLLEETPWVLDARDESERKQRVALLFDLNRMASEQERALTKLAQMQQPSGGWPWFEGMREDPYITQHIVAGLGHLDQLGVRRVRQDENVFQMIKNAVSFLDQQLKKQYDELKRLEKKKQLKLSDNHLAYLPIHYLYARSFFKDLPVAKSAQEALAYYQGQAKTYWQSGNSYQQGMIALGLFRGNEKAVPAAIVKSLRERALLSEEMGMYWKNDAGYYWYQAPIETQALLIEVFDEVANDQKAVEEMKIWLLKQKQTQDWRTTKATTEACYALLLKGTDWLTSDVSPAIQVGDQTVDPKEREGGKVEAGTGYFKTSWTGSEIKPAMGTVTVHKKDAGVSWGALYWQYFEQLDKITPHATPLSLKKALFLQKASPTGPVLTPVLATTALQPGDLLKVRIELRVDRNMEYVHLKDMRAAGLEPTNVLSGYRYQDGLGYYESTRDAATHFFFDYLPKGTYVFEYPLRVTHEGDFSNGVTSIQSMYAPEFSSHSQGIRVKVGK
jgi:uncharacterized protein YfaS (alpha-2-macroglobulin family)